MSSELITSWTDHDNSLRRILLLATQTIRVFDADLATVKLEPPANAELLRDFLGRGQNNRLQIVVKNAEPFRRDSPRLMKLLATYPERMTIVECPPHLAALNDSMLICDDRHALVRFHLGQARAKVIVDSASECAPYVQRFAAIVEEGGAAIGATTLGL